MYFSQSTILSYFTSRMNDGLSDIIFEFPASYYLNIINSGLVSYYGSGATLRIAISVNSISALNMINDYWEMPII